jgi:hypothetical protein
MSDLKEWRWRAVALQLFPEFRSEIKQAESAHGVFFELFPAIRDAYWSNPIDEDRIERIYEYAFWCIAPDQHPDEQGAALASFFEHLPGITQAWRDLPRWATPEQISMLRERLREYLVEESSYSAAMAELDAAEESHRTAVQRRGGSVVKRLGFEDRDR